MTDRAYNGLVSRARSVTGFSFVGGLALLAEVACSGTPLTTHATADGAAGAAGSTSGADAAAGSTSGADAAAGVGVTPFADAGVGTCDSLSIAACVNASKCGVLMGQPIDEQRSCVLASQPLACIPLNSTCDAVVTRATDPTGKAWSFTCDYVPAGWTNVTGSNAYFPSCATTDGGADAPVQM